MNYLPQQVVEVVVSYKWEPGRLEGSLARIRERLPSIATSSSLSEIIQSDVQGVYVRYHNETIELYCYDPETRNLSDIMSRIDLANPLRLIGTYSQIMMLSVLWSGMAPRRVYVAGFGGGRLTMPIHHFFQGCLIDGSDFDPAILKAAERFFGIDFEDRYNIRSCDSALDMVQREGPYDIIFIDVFANQGTHPGHLASPEFFENCSRKLEAHGVLAINLVDHDPSLKQKTENLKQALPYVVKCEKDGATILFGSKTKVDFETIEKRASEFQNAANINYRLHSHARALRQLLDANRNLRHLA